MVGGLERGPRRFLELVEFLVAQYADLDAAFRVIDGEHGNGVLSLAEFRVGVVTHMRCRKFRGPDETARVEGIFRYLDPNDDHEVSKKEWLKLRDLWREVQLSIRELVRFLQVCLGERFAAPAWEIFDFDSNGSVDEGEWMAAVRRLGFFGPALPIFHFMDKDDEGTISLAEFVALEAFATDGGSRAPVLASHGLAKAAAAAAGNASGASGTAGG